MRDLEEALRRAREARGKPRPRARDGWRARLRRTVSVARARRPSAPSDGADPRSVARCHRRRPEAKPPCERQHSRARRASGRARTRSWTGRTSADVRRLWARPKEPPSTACRCTDERESRRVSGAREGLRFHGSAAPAGHVREGRTKLQRGGRLRRKRGTSLGGRRLRKAFLRARP